MISTSAISSSGGATKYLNEQNGQQSATGAAEYYGDVRSTWGGQAADIFRGENGQIVGQGEAVRSADMTKALDGYIRDGNGEDRRLGVERGGVWQHRCGRDLTFGAPKSLSIQSEVFGDKSVREIHERGVDAAMAYLERDAAVAHIRGQDVQTGNLLYTKHEHSNARPVGGIVDPQMHTHVAVANATFDAGSSRWYSLRDKEILDHRATADTVYKASMAADLVAAGHRLEFDGKGGWELAGYTAAQIDEFSSRQAQMNEFLAARGIDPATATDSQKNQAWEATRAAKDSPDSAAAQREQWQARANAVGAAMAKPDPALVREPTAADARAILTSALSHLTEREAAFSSRDLVKSTMTFAEGRARPAQIFEQIDKAISAGEVIVREDGKLTTREMVQAEQHMAQRLEAGQGQHIAIMSEREFTQALTDFEAKKGFSLSIEQRDAAKMILTGDDRFQGVQGLAGTGKTTMLELVREAAESKGWKVDGFSNGGEQASKMQAESGIATTTTASHLISGEKALADARLATAALRTYESSIDKWHPTWNELKQAAGRDDGLVSREFDRSGRVYYTEKLSGNTYTPDLYQRVSTVDSANLNHAGLTSTTYHVAENGEVFKQGGTLVSEAAGAIHKSIDAALAENRGLSGDVMRTVAGDVLHGSERWIPASLVESAIVYARAEAQTEALRGQAVAALSAQANAASGEPQKTLAIMDEASQSGQREFNRVIDASERSGAKAVFLGDHLQHQSVEAGRAFELAQPHMRMSEIGRDSIRRQADGSVAKEAVSNVLDGKHADAMRGLPTHEIRDAQRTVEEKYENRDMTDKSTREAMKLEMMEAKAQDNSAVIKELAKDYTALAPEARNDTIVITATNADKAEIVGAIRENLKEQGALADGKTITTLEKTDRTEAQMERAASFSKGETVQFGADYKRMGIDKGDIATVVSTDARANTVTAQTETGHQVTFRPDKTNASVYELREKEFAVGDRVRFTKNETDRETGFQARNGQTGTVEKFDGKSMSVKLDGGKSMEVNTDRYRHVDHAYASTSHASQGQSKGGSWMHHNTESGRHGDRETYVNVTRAKEDVRVYTADASKAAIQSGQRMDKEAATSPARTSAPAQSRPAEVGKPQDKSVEPARPQQTAHAGDQAQTKAADAAKSQDRSIEPARPQQPSQSRDPAQSKSADGTKSQDKSIEPTKPQQQPTQSRDPAQAKSADTAKTQDKSVEPAQSKSADGTKSPDKSIETTKPQQQPTQARDPAQTKPAEVGKPQDKSIEPARPQQPSQSRDPAQSKSADTAKAQDKSIEPAKSQQPAQARAQAQSKPAEVGKSQDKSTGSSRDTGR